MANRLGQLDGFSGNPLAVIRRIGQWLEETDGSLAAVRRQLSDPSSDIVLAIAASMSGSGWTESGTYVYLTTTTDFVGIGTTTPTVPLDVRGKTKITVAKTGTTLIGLAVETGDQTASAYTGSQAGLQVHPLINANSGTPTVYGALFDCSGVRGTIGGFFGLDALYVQSNTTTSTANPDSNAGVRAGIDCTGTLNLTRFAGFMAQFGDQFGSGALNCTSLAGFRYLDPGEFGGGGGTIDRLYGVLVDPDTAVANGSATAFWAAAFGGDVEIDNGYRLFWAATGATAIASRAAAFFYNSGTSQLEWEIGTTRTMALSSTTLTLADAVNIAVNTTTGTKIGTATSQKIGFWNTTPVNQPSAYTVTNPTTNRSLDVSAATAAQVRQVLGTLIADLQSVGLVG